MVCYTTGINMAYYGKIVFLTIIKITTLTFASPGIFDALFLPSPLIVHKDDQATGFINVTLEDMIVSMEYSTLSLCALSLEPQIATIESSFKSLLYNNTWLESNVSVNGVRLGRTKFMIYILISSNNQEINVSRECSLHTMIDIDKGKAEQSLNRSVRDGKGKNHTANRTWDLGLPLNHKQISNETFMPSGSGILNDTQYENKTWFSFLLARKARNIDHDNVQMNLFDQNSSFSSILNDWMLLGEYDVVVIKPDKLLAEWLDYFVMTLMAINMVGIGGQINGLEVIYNIKKPVAVSAGMFCRFGLVPALGLGLVELMQPCHQVSLGVLSFLCSPHEGVGCLLNLLAEKDLTLSVTMMSIINFASIAMLPLWTIAFERRLYDDPGRVDIPFNEVFVLFGATIVCTMVGFCLYQRFPKSYVRIWTYMPLFTSFTILTIIGVDIYKHDYIFELVTAPVFFLAAILSVTGYLLGFVVAYMIGQPITRVFVIAIETGCRTTFLTTMLLDGSFDPPEGDISKTTPVLGGLLSLAPGFVAVLLYRGYYHHRGYPSTKGDSMIGEPIENGFIDDDIDIDLDSDEGKVAIRETAM